MIITNGNNYKKVRFSLKHGQKLLVLLSVPACTETKQRKSQKGKHKTRRFTEEH
jgi:hypothetical protein